MPDTLALVFQGVGLALLTMGGWIGGVLAGGVMIGGVVQCPRHGSQFDCRSGVKAGPAEQPISTRLSARYVCGSAEASAFTS